MEFLEPFPEVVALGRSRLQVLCDEWVETPIARECAIRGVVINEAATGFSDVQVLATHQVQDQEDFHFPADNLLRYIIEQTFHEPKASELKIRLMALRQKVGPIVFQRYRANLYPFSKS